MVQARVNELTADHASLTAKTEQAKAERNTLGARNREMEVAAATCNGELSFRELTIRFSRLFVA